MMRNSLGKDALYDFSELEVDPDVIHSVDFH
jgi:hypothetical protein